MAAAEPHYLAGYIAMSPVNADRVDTLQLLSSTIAEVAFFDGTPTPYIPFKDSPLAAVNAAKLAFGRAGDEEWKILQVNFTPDQVFKLFVKHQICRIDTPTLGFRLYVDAADIDAGVHLADYSHTWYGTHPPSGSHLEELGLTSGSAAAGAMET